MASCDSRLPSKADLYKLKRQAEYIAEVGTGRDENNQPIDSATNPDTGETVKTIRGVEKEFDDFLVGQSERFDTIANSYGFDFSLGVFAAGKTVTSYNQVLEYNGTFVRLTRQFLPYEIQGSTPDTDPANWITVYDDSQIHQVAVANNVAFDEVAILATTAVPVTNIFYFWDMNTQTTYRAPSPVTGTITAIGAIGDTVDITVDGVVVALYEDSIYSLRANRDIRGWGAVGDARISAANPVAGALFGQGSLYNTNATDSTVAIQAAIDDVGEIVIPPLAFKISTVKVSKNRTSIKGLTGASEFLITSEGVRPDVMYTGEICELSGIKFSGETSGVAYGVSSPTDVYLSHWNIHNCVFSQSLRYGINANAVGCVIENNDFGAPSAIGGAVFQPIKILGEPLDTIPFPHNPNANVIKNNWIKRASGVDHAVELGAGLSPIFIENLVESNNCAVSAILCDGSFYPKFNNNYFEGNTGESVVKFTNDPTGQRSCHFVNFDNNYVRCYDSKPELSILDFNGCNTDQHSLNMCLIAATGASMQGVVRDKNGSYDSMMSVNMVIGNHITGQLASSKYSTLSTMIARIDELMKSPKITDAIPKVILHSSASGLSSSIGYRTGASVEIGVPSGGLLYLQSNGSDRYSVSGEGHLYPIASEVQNLGSPSQKFNTLYILNTPVGTSDERLKNIDEIPDDVLKAALKLRAIRFTWKNRPNGRYHIGYSAQNVFEVFRGVCDPFDYSFMCSDALVEELELGVVIPIVDGDGNPIERLGLRYTELLLLRQEALLRART